MGMMRGVHAVAEPPSVGTVAVVAPAGITMGQMWSEFESSWHDHREEGVNRPPNGAYT
jgi:hypothetical protein